MTRVRVQKTPFSYAVIDNFAPAQMLHQILKDWPSEGWIQRNSNNTLNKRFISDRSKLPDSVLELLDSMNSAESCEQIQKALGLKKPLYPDPELKGGGLHEILPGGFLNVHVDFNQHPKTKLRRKANVLLYLNERWRNDWKGELEIWDMQSKRCVEKVHPIFNRAVAFECSESSFHGHPAPLAAPVSRKSVAVYYYSDEPVEQSHNTIYVDTQAEIQNGD